MNSADASHDYVREGVCRGAGVELLVQMAEPRPTQLFLHTFSHPFLRFGRGRPAPLLLVLVLVLCFHTIGNLETMHD